MSMLRQYDPLDRITKEVRTRFIGTGTDPADPATMNITLTIFGRNSYYSSALRMTSQPHSL